MLFLKIFLMLSGQKNAKNRVKIPKSRLFEIEKKSEKTLKTQMQPMNFMKLSFSVYGEKINLGAVVKVKNFRQN
jgi:hypothetical protein